MSGDPLFGAGEGEGPGAGVEPPVFAPADGDGAAEGSFAEVSLVIASAQLA